MPTSHHKEQFIMSTIDLIAEKDAVKAALEDWIAAVENKDMALLPNTVAHEADRVWIGAGANDWLAGWEALEQAILAQNAALDDIRITVSDETIHVSPDECFAWATNRWVFAARLGDQALALPLRCTWILEKRAADWVIVHFHKSAGMSH
jgi:ketosteroid isomerase-like protein